MSITLGDMPLFDKQAYQRDYNKTEKGKGSREIYRKTRGKHVTDAKYLSREIVAIDGEGINVRSGRRKGDHLYVMLAISDCPPLVDKNGLKTKDILNYLWDNLSSSNINVIYGGSYDFNLWIRDLLEDEVRALYKSSYTSKPVFYEGFGLRWIKGKAFEITDGERTVTINDVISFFQRPFVQACEEYLGYDFPHKDVIVREKAARGNFKVSDLDNVAQYNQYELELLVQLVEELRVRLNRVGLRPRRWNSPGAIASALFQRENIKDYRDEQVPEEVSRAARYAYAGGRFEMLKYGSVKEPVYEYDINSAYPAALREVPSLAHGKWVHHTKLGNFENFTVYRVRFTGTNAAIPGAIFCRGSNGTISYPLVSENWIWSPEFETLKKYCAQIEGASYTFIEAWEFVADTNNKPFAFIQELFDKRKELKKAKDGAQVGIKLALNSLYGKLAQQVGWMPATTKHPVRVPTYHQLEWAGYATSWCRARVLEAALTDIDAIIAFETDALFSTRPLNVDIGEGLGQWDVVEFESLTYVQSGHYYGTEVDEDGKKTEVIKCRGIDKGFISRKNVEDLLSLPEPQRVLEASLTRFYGAGIALARGLNKYWCKWLTEPKFMQLRPTGKRLHGNCFCTGSELEIGVWHRTFCPVIGGVSSEYPVEWINPNPEMNELSEMREGENFYDD